MGLVATNRGTVPVVNQLRNSAVVVPVGANGRATGQ